MPAAVEACVKSVLKKWSANPKQKPKRHKKNGKWVPIKSSEDLTSAAWAICQKSVKAGDNFCQLSERTEHELTVLALGEGKGPVLRGVGWLNRPYIKFMRPLQIIEKDGKKLILAQLAKYGIYEHPQGPDGLLPFTKEFWSRVIENFKANVFGQKIFADKAHDPDAGSLGELLELVDTGDGVDGIFEPTERGLQEVQTKNLNYASIDLHFDYADNLVQVAAGEELQLADWTQKVFEINQLEIDEEVSMADETPQETPVTPDSGAQLSEVAILRQQLATEMTQLSAERTAFLKERAEQRESLRRQRVEVFVDKLAQANDKGLALVQPVIDIIKTVMLGDSLKTEAGEIQLGEALSTAPEVHAYYRTAIEQLSVAVPRTVPTGSQVEDTEHRPQDNVALLRERDARKQAMIDAKKQNKAWGDLSAAELKEIDDSLDRIYGVKEG